MGVINIIRARARAGMVDRADNNKGMGNNRGTDNRGMRGTSSSNNNRLYPVPVPELELEQRRRQQAPMEDNNPVRYPSWSMGCRIRATRAGLMRLGKGIGVGLLPMRTLILGGERELNFACACLCGRGRGCSSNGVRRGRCRL